MTVFEPIQVGNLQLQHRIVLPPMTRLRCDAKGVPTDMVVEYYAQRGTPGGLLITEGTVVSSSAGSYPHISGIYTQEQIAGWRKVAEAVHAKGGYIFCQVGHFGRVASEQFNENHEPPIGPSAVAVNGPNKYIFPIGSAQFEIPREATKEDIKDLLDQHAQAAKNVIQAGFDGVEIHGANGYLVDQFINSSSNKRTDAYGGSAEKRARFAVEVVEAVAATIGPERTAIRLSPFSGLQDMKDETPYETWCQVLTKLNPKLAYVHFIEPREDFSSQPDLVNTLDPF